MRHAAALLFVLPLVSAGLRAEGYGPSLTVLVDFQQAASPESVGEMRREIQHILKPAGVDVDVRLRSEVGGNQDFQDLVLVKFKGACRPLDPMLVDERGPAAFARSYTMDGDVQPFGEVACDRVRRAVESAMWGGERDQAETLFGRALGRVVAHELFHMLGSASRHSKTGVFKESLSGAQLISGSLELSSKDAEDLRRKLAK
jgi:hypothetical protein